MASQIGGLPMASRFFFLIGCGMLMLGVVAMLDGRRANAQHHSRCRQKCRAQFKKVERAARAPATGSF